VSLAATVALLNITSRIITQNVHTGKISTCGEFSGVYWKYEIFSVFFVDRDNFLSTDRDQEGWHNGSTLHNSKVKHIFHNVHNFVNNLVQFYAQIVFNCGVRRLKPFVGSAYKNTKYFTAKVLYGAADAAGEERLSCRRATAEKRPVSRWPEHRSGTNNG
jgi:hypothetical protein